MSTTLSAITDRAADRRMALEGEIEKGLRAFESVGRSLREIRDERLWAFDHDSFESYCNDRWGLSRVHAFRLIEASDVTDLLREALPKGSTAPPSNERQARELAPLRDNPKVLAEVWSQLRERHDGTLTADHVRAAVSQRLGRPASPPQPSPPLSPSRYDTAVQALRDIRDAPSSHAHEIARRTLAELGA